MQQQAQWTGGCWEAFTDLLTPNPSPLCRKNTQKGDLSPREEQTALDLPSHKNSLFYADCLARIILFLSTLSFKTISLLGFC